MVFSILWTFSTKIITNWLSLDDQKLERLKKIFHKRHASFKQKKNIQELGLQTTMPVN